MNNDYTNLFVPFKELTISDDYMFTKVMLNKNISRQIVNLLLNLDIKEDEIEYIEEQKVIKIRSDSKGIRLDILLLAQNLIINLEMQNSNNVDLAKRTRYYQDIIDSFILKAGEDYRNLIDIYVIFICTFDPFSKNLPRYTFKSVCIEDTSLIMNDGINKIFINTTEYAKEKSEELKQLLAYLNGEDAEGNLINEIKNEVQKIKNNDYWEDDYMKRNATRSDDIFLGEQRGEQRGIGIGRQEGERNKALNMAYKMINRGKDTLDEIAEMTDLPLDIIKDLSQNPNLPKYTSN